MLSNIKKILYPAVLLIFFAFTFQSKPPGWYQQTLPRTDFNIRDIFFIDSLKGWANVRKASSTDTAFIIHTSNGGTNWVTQYKIGNFTALYALQFLDENTGYSVGTSNGINITLKTTNGGVNWIENFSGSSGVFNDLSFANKDTGLVCSNDLFDGGVFKTINGGINWIRQLNADHYESIFFLNNDTGWVINNASQKQLLRTTNGGSNWILQHSFPSTLGDVYFYNSDTGWVTSGTNYRTTNGGNNWIISQSTNVSGFKLSFINSLTGWAGANLLSIRKTTDGGITWGNQTTNISNPTVFAIDSLRVWAGGSGIVHTTDGGGPIMDIQQISTELPANYNLYQNYPNPFNPTTKISFSVKRQTSNVRLLVYDINGKLIETLISKSLPAGTYETNFNANNLSSGIYFYTLITDNFSQTKKMILLK